MKKSIFVLGAFAAVALTSCKKAETTEVSNVDTTATAVIVDNDSMPITTDSTVTAVDNSMENAVDATGDAVQEGAAEVKDAANDATDGDGNIAK